MKCHHVKCRNVIAVEKFKIRDATNGIRANISLVECGSKMNQVEVGGHVTPRSNHARMREIQRLYMYETVQLIMT